MGGGGGGTAVARPLLGPQGPILITIPPPRPLSPSFPTEREFEEIAALKFLAGEIVLNYEPSRGGKYRTAHFHSPLPEATVV